MLVDSHCHLDHEKIEGDPQELIQRARDAGVEHIVSIATKLENFARVKAIVAPHPDVSMAVGVHPHSAGEAGLYDTKALLELCQDPDVVGIGETGLDYFYDYGPVADQKRNFEVHIEASQETGLPLIVHTREAEDDTIRILQDEAQAGAFPGLIHCFTGTPKLRDAALELGLYISVSGIATFKKSELLRQTLSAVPLDRLLVETDAPYLAPPPFRGKRNEPSYVAHTARKGAEVFGMDYADFAAQTEANFERLFSKAALSQASAA